MSMAGLFVALLLARWIFAIDAHMSHQKMQTRLLQEMAKKLGVDTATIEQIAKDKGDVTYGSVKPNPKGIIKP